MKQLIRLARRNLWRNKRRTLISISSVLFGAFFCIVMVSFMEGTMGYMVNSVIERETGHFQVMDKRYWDDRTVETFITTDSSVIRKLEANPNTKQVIPRAETFAMAWNGTKTRPVYFRGIDPQKENEVAKLSKRIEQGSYLTKGDNGIIVGKKLAESMKLNVGDTLTLIGQGYQGSSAAGLFPVKGIFKAFDPLSDGRLIYTDLAALQYYIGMEGGLSGIAVIVRDEHSLDKTIAELKTEINNPEFDFVSWKTLLADTASGMASDKESMTIFFYVLYIIVGFGMLSTVIMMTNERKKEFGVMIALGMKRRSIVASLFLEIAFTGLIGVLAASLLSLPLVAYLHYYPLQIPMKEVSEMIAEFGLENYLPFALDAKIFITQMIIVIAIALLCMFYPYHKIMKMQVINALKN